MSPAFLSIKRSFDERSLEKWGGMAKFATRVASPTGCAAVRS
jgi:hypothetical protein